jgi:hypothetical protein
MYILGLGLGKSIYSKEQIEEFAWFQDSQNTQRAYLAEAEELAYLGRSGGEWGLSLTDLAKENIVDVLGYHLIPLYWLVRPAAVIIILIMFIVGMVRMLLDIMVRAIVIARVRGCSFWMFGALWDTALLQVAISPIRWVVEKGWEGTGHNKNQMEARVAYTGVAGEIGTSDNLEVLADWATPWCRKDSDHLWKRSTHPDRKKL